MAQIPIPKIDPKNKTDRAQHDALVAHVERMLKLHADIAATDHAIDALVYALYGLTPEEIQLVEQATAPAAAQPAVD